MQAKATVPEDESPSMLWGLDPIFSAFARLYVRDILEMVESTQVPEYKAHRREMSAKLLRSLACKHNPNTYDTAAEAFIGFYELIDRQSAEICQSISAQKDSRANKGVYFYNQHPIYKVDVLGIVVYKRERDDFFCYGVDDGTGVINCLCWKNDLFKEKVDSNQWERCSEAAVVGFNPFAELEKLREAQQSRCRLEIGELLRVRGLVKTSRQQREITASTFYKVDDPMMVAQIAWMMEVPELYRVFYDKPLQLQSLANGDSSMSSLCKAARLIKDFLKQKSVTKFRPYDVQELLQPLVSNQLQTTAALEEPVAGPSACQQLQRLLREALQILQDEGEIYRRIKSQDELYHVTSGDKDLQIAVKDIIREDSKREKYADKGCHVLHILSAVRQRHSLNVSKAALELVLKSLECSSDIVSMSENHYTMF